MPGEARKGSPGSKDVIDTKEGERDVEDAKQEGEPKAVADDGGRWETAQVEIATFRSYHVGYCSFEKYSESIDNVAKQVIDFLAEFNVAVKNIGMCLRAAGCYAFVEYRRAVEGELPANDSEDDTPDPSDRFGPWSFLHTRRKRVLAQSKRVSDEQALCDVLSAAADENEKLNGRRLITFTNILTSEIGNHVVLWYHGPVASIPTGYQFKFEIFTPRGRWGMPAAESTSSSSSQHDDTIVARASWKKDTYSRGEEKAETERPASSALFQWIAEAVSCKAATAHEDTAIASGITQQMPQRTEVRLITLSLVSCNFSRCVVATYYSAVADGPLVRSPPTIEEVPIVVFKYMFPSVRFRRPTNIVSAVSLHFVKAATENLEATWQQFRSAFRTVSESINTVDAACRARTTFRIAVSASDDGFVVALFHNCSDSSFLPNTLGDNATKSGACQIL